MLAQQQTVAQFLPINSCRNPHHSDLDNLVQLTWGQPHWPAITHTQPGLYKLNRLLQLIPPATTKHHLWVKAAACSTGASPVPRRRGGRPAGRLPAAHTPGSCPQLPPTGSRGPQRQLTADGAPHQHLWAARVVNISRKESDQVNTVRRGSR